VSHLEPLAKTPWRCAELSSEHCVPHSIVYGDTDHLLHENDSHDAILRAPTQPMVVVFERIIVVILSSHYAALLVEDHWSCTDRRVC